MTQEVRTIKSAAVTEVFITSIPQPGIPLERQVKEAFAAIRDTLKKTGARLVQERVFGAPEILKKIPPVRAEAYGDLDDGVEPAYLVVPPNLHSPFCGVQVHAVNGLSRIDPVDVAGRLRGRTFDCNGRKYLALSGVTAPAAGNDEVQARTAFVLAEEALKRFGGDFFSVARTWMWLGKILDWYGEFNAVRNRFFVERGLMGTGNFRLPASTGIGIGPLDGGALAMDLFAVMGPEDSIRYLLKGGNQNPASDYGSAFSRASCAKTPGGSTVYVSGTAAIDHTGKTEHVGNVQAQISDTVKHVRAVLTDMGCRDEDVVHVLAYCKTSEVEKAFRTGWADLPWPCVTVISDVCRDDLLFEIEATACPGANSPLKM